MFGDYIAFIEKNLDMTALRRNVIADNISNYNTPNFKATKVSFDHVFEEHESLRMRQPREKHLPIKGSNTTPHLYKTQDGKERLDGNNVDLNVEMIDMIKNNSKHNQAIEAVNKEFYLMKKAIGN